jgi:hypothetical protein
MLTARTAGAFVLDKPVREPIDVMLLDYQWVGAKPGLGVGLGPRLGAAT